MNRFISTLLIITIIALTGTCIHFYLSSKKMQLEIADNIIETQNAEAEALQLQKKIGFLRTDILVIQSEKEQLTMVNKELNQQLRHFKAKLTEANQWKISREEHEKQLDELTQKLIENGETSQKTENRLRFENAELLAQNHQLIEQSHQLQNQLSDYKLRNIYNIRVEAVRGSDMQPVTRASATQSLIMQFDISNSPDETLKFIIVTPTGQHITSQENPNFNVNKTSTLHDRTSIEMSYQDDRFEKGIYGIWIYRDTLLTAQAQVKLR